MKVQALYSQDCSLLSVGIAMKAPAMYCQDYSPLSAEIGMKAPALCSQDYSLLSAGIEDESSNKNSCWELIPNLINKHGGEAAGTQWWYPAEDWIHWDNSSFCLGGWAKKELKKKKKMKKKMKFICLWSKIRSSCFMPDVTGDYVLMQPHIFLFLVSWQIALWTSHGQSNFPLNIFVSTWRLTVQVLCILIKFLYLPVWRSCLAALYFTPSLSCQEIDFLIR